jgi:hypothetical protein
MSKIKAGIEAKVNKSNNTKFKKALVTQQFLGIRSMVPKLLCS